MDPSKDAEPKACKRVWAQDVNVAAAVMETKLDELRVSTASWTPAQQAVEDGVRRRLDAARRATLRRDPVPGGLSNWWRGTLVDAAYQNLHAAESMIVGIYGPADIEAQVPEAVARVEAGLDRDDPRRIAALQLLEGSPSGHGRTATLAKAVEIGFSASDAEYARLRNFRNTVLGGASAMAVLLLAFVIYVYRNPTDVPLCFSGTDGPICASGAAAPSGHDVITVVLLGSLGGLLAAILAIKNMQSTASPYNVPQALALLKLPLGAVSAIGALIAIRGDFVPGFANLDSQAQILAYAFGFGLAQQLLTGLVDKQARGILSTTPGKATGAVRPERQMPHPSLAASLGTAEETAAPPPPFGAQPNPA